MTRPTQAHDAPTSRMRMPAILRVTDTVPAAWPSALGRATTLGFDAMLLPAGAAPPEALIEAAQALGVTLLVDIDIAVPELANGADAEKRARHCAALLHGAGGARLLGLDRVHPDGLVPFLLALRRLLPGAVLFGWTPGISWSALAAIPPGALDLVAASLPWWDGRADWLWQELDLLRRIAPVIADAGADSSRDAFAAVLSEGWMTHDGTSAGPLAAMRCSILKGLPWSRLVSPAGMGAYALLRTDAAHPRSAGRAVLAFAAISPARLGTSLPLMATGGAFGPFIDTVADDLALVPGDIIPLPPGALRLFSATRRDDPVAAPISRADAAAAVAAPCITISAITPCADASGLPHGVVGSAMVVGCLIEADGVPRIGAVLRWRGPDDDAWTDAPLIQAETGHWTGTVPLYVPGIHQAVIKAWPDDYAAFIDGPNPTPDHATRLIRAAAATSRKRTLATLDHALSVLTDGDAAAQHAIMHAPATRAAMMRAEQRRHGAECDPITVTADRTEARFAAWCSVAAPSPQPLLPCIQAMGFDVLHVPQAGLNTAPNAAMGAPLAPEAMRAVLDLRDAVAAHGIELALDFAVEGTADPVWDPSRSGAHHPLAADATPDLWCGLAAAALFWVRHGIRCFHVPDPLAMPVAFWSWLIPAIQSRHPDTLFAMARPAGASPRLLQRLAQAGFGQASMAPLTEPGMEHLATITHGTPRANLVASVTKPHSAALAEVALAATLSGLWTLRHDMNSAGIGTEIAMLNGIRRRNPALHGHQGPTMLDPGTDGALLFQHETPNGTSIVLVAISLNTSQPQIVRIGHRWPTPMHATDLLHGGSAHWAAPERLVTLTAEHPYALWRLCPVPVSA